MPERNNSPQSPPRQVRRDQRTPPREDLPETAARLCADRTPGPKARWGRWTNGGIRVSCADTLCGNGHAAVYHREGYSRPIVVCDKCAGVQKPGGAESNAAQDWIADLRSVLSTLDGGQYLTCRAATQYRNRNYATLPQTCNAGTGCQQAIDAPACPGHRWPLWGVYTVKKLLEDPTFAADFEIRQTARVYHLDGREVWRTKQVIMRRDAPRPRTWLLGACQDGEWDDLEAQERERQAAATERRHRWERERQAWIDGLMQGEMEGEQKTLRPPWWRGTGGYECRDDGIRHGSAGVSGDEIRRGRSGRCRCRSRPPRRCPRLP